MTRRFRHACQHARVQIVRGGAIPSRTERHWDSHGVFIGHIAEFARARGTRVTVASYERNSVLGRHETRAWQAFAVLVGADWVADDREERVLLQTGDVVVWSPGEHHASGSDRRMTVCIVETTEDPLADIPERGRARR